MPIHAYLKDQSCSVVRLLGITGGSCSVIIDRDVWIAGRRCWDFSSSGQDPRDDEKWMVEIIFNRLLYADSRGL